MCDQATIYNAPYIESTAENINDENSFYIFIHPEVNCLIACNFEKSQGNYIDQEDDEYKTYLHAKLPVVKKSLLSQIADLDVSHNEGFIKFLTEHKHCVDSVYSVTTNGSTRVVFTSEHMMSLGYSYNAVDAFVATLQSLTRYGSQDAQTITEKFIDAYKTKGSAIFSETRNHTIFDLS